MRIGAVFPQTDMAPDSAQLATYARAVENMGFDYVLAYDHVLGADTSVRPKWRNRGRVPHYTHESAFHEVFVLFGYMAAMTERIGFATGILILPQRQTALVAKQAAQVDIVSRGRFRLGVGIGWNDVECEGMGMSFPDRSERSEEQISLLRALWTQESVTFRGRWDRIEAAGINPLPLQRPIPIFLGGQTETALKRAARVADGCFMPMLAKKENGALDRLRRYMADAGRDPGSMGLETEILTEGKTVGQWLEAALAWKDLGGTHMVLNTLVTGPDAYPLPVHRPVEEHLARLSEFMEAARAAGVP
jgi:probable F420-dependent oxidoreductase